MLNSTSENTKNVLKSQNNDNNNNGISQQLIENRFSKVDKLVLGVRCLGQCSGSEFSAVVCGK